MKQLTLFCMLFLLGTSLTLQAQAPRKVLVEAFVNANDANVIAQNPYFDSLMLVNDSNLVVLKYSTNFGGADPLYNASSADVSARTLYYGISAANKCFLDGNYQNQSSLGGMTQQAIDSALQITSPITIEISHSLNHSNNSVTVSTKVKNISANFLSTPSSLQVALVERMVNSNGTVYYNVLRKFIPDVAGTPFNSLAAGDSISSTNTAVLATGIDLNELIAVAFVQETTSKNVIQAEQSKMATNVAVNRLEEAMAADFTFFPNPASEQVQLQLVNFEGDASCQVLNTLGQTVLQTAISSQSKMLLNLSELPAGQYWLCAKLGNHYVTKPLLIKGRD